jgi:transposase
MNEVRREGKLLGTVVRMLKEVEAGIAGMIRAERKRRHPAQPGQNHPIARRLAEISRSRAANRRHTRDRGILSRVQESPGSRELRRLDADTLQRGTMVRDQGISKAGNRRARAVAVELAWIWLRNQPESKLSRWFRVETRRGEGGGLRSSLWRAN